MNAQSYSIGCESVLMLVLLMALQASENQLSASFSHSLGSRHSQLGETSHRYSIVGNVFGIKTKYANVTASWNPLRCR